MSDSVPIRCASFYASLNRNHTEGPRAALSASEHGRTVVNRRRVNPEDGLLIDGFDDASGPAVNLFSLNDLAEGAPLSLP